MRESTTPPSQPSVIETHGFELLRAILRWGWFVLGGAVLGLSIALLFVLLWPRTRDCEATLSLPDLEQAAASPASPRAPKPGVPLAIYKEFAASLNDSALLTEAFRGTLDEGQIQALRLSLGEHVSPVTTGTRDEIRRSDKDDNIIAVSLVYGSRSAETAEQVVGTLANLVRRALVTHLARKRIDTEVLQAMNKIDRDLTAKTTLSNENESLRILEGSLQRIATDFPVTGAATREVVDVNQGGHRFLPANVQLVGAKAQRAGNEHSIRVLQRSLTVDGLRVALLKRLDQRIRQDLAARRAFDIVAVIDEELARFVAQHAGEDAEYLRSHAVILRDLLSSYRDSISFVQYPTLRKRARAPVVVAALTSWMALVLIVPVAVEFWRRLAPQLAEG